MNGVHWRDIRIEKMGKLLNSVRGRRLLQPTHHTTPCRFFVLFLMYLVTWMIWYVLPYIFRIDLWPVIVVVWSFIYNIYSMIFDLSSGTWWAACKRSSSTSARATTDSTWSSRCAACGYCRWGGRWSLIFVVWSRSYPGCGKIFSRGDNWMIS